MDLSSLIKEISGNNTSVIDPIYCIHKGILYVQEVMMSAILEKFLSPEGHNHPSVDPILQRGPKVC
jgi:hypothetical protein